MRAPQQPDFAVPKPCTLALPLGWHVRDCLGRPCSTPVQHPVQHRQWYVGHFDDDDDECIYFFPADERNRRAKSSGGAYQRLCVTRRFAYLGIEDDD